MGRGDQLTITVVEADLVRIFDKVMNKQDVYAQLISTYDDGTQSVVGRTGICRHGNTKPKWSESFTYNRGRALRLTFQVIADRAWRGQVLCGEAIIDMAQLWNRAQCAAPLVLPLNKNETQTGVLHLAVGPSGAQGRSHSAPHAGAGAAAAAAQATEMAGGARRKRGMSGDVPVVNVGCGVPIFRRKNSRTRTSGGGNAHRRSSSDGAITSRRVEAPAGGAAREHVHPSGWWNSFIQRG